MVTGTASMPSVYNRAQRLVALPLLLGLVLSLMPWDSFELLEHGHAHHLGLEGHSSVPLHDDMHAVPPGAPDDDPCGDGCLCPCCPGHAAWLAPRLGFGGVGLYTLPALPYLAGAALHPLELAWQLERPPRDIART